MTDEEIVKCDCYEVALGEPFGFWQKAGRCNGTKERDFCDCGGNKLKCSFYPEVKAKAQMGESIKEEYKTLNTAEMWIRSYSDGLHYIMKHKPDYEGDIIFQKDKGFMDENGDPVPIETWNWAEDFMNEEWEVYTMTKREAERKLGVKIVG